MSAGLVFAASTLLADADHHIESRTGLGRLGLRLGVQGFLASWQLLRVMNIVLLDRWHRVRIPQVVLRSCIVVI